MTRYRLLPLGIGGLCALGALASAGREAHSRPGVEVPTIRARRGALSLVVRGSGDLRAARSLALTAPAAAGPLLISKTLPTGTVVAAGDVVLEFDPAEQLRLEDEAQADLAVASQQLEKARLEETIEEVQGRLTALQAQLEVRTAELDAGRNELVSAIDAQRNVLTLDEARRRLAQVERDALSRRASSQAAAALAAERLRSARLRLEQARSAREGLRLRAAQAGIVSIKPRQDSPDGQAAPGLPPPSYQAGDSVEPGVAVAEILEPGAMEIQVGLDEAAVAHVRVDLPADVRVDSLPHDDFHGTITSVAGVATSSGFPGMGPRTFDVVVQLDRPDPRLRPGLTARVAILGGERRDALLVPALALEDAGPTGTVVRVREGSELTTRSVEVAARGETLAAVSGIEEGAAVALGRPANADAAP
jgi:HlyD family secretion protein